MKLAQVKEVFGNQDHRWLGSKAGVDQARTVSLAVPAFTLGTHAPGGYFPDGLPIAIPTSGTYAGKGVPIGAKASETQTVTITGTPTGGTFTLTLDGETTAAIAYNANAAAVQTALENLSNLSPGDVTVTGGPGPGTPFSVAFGGNRLGRDVPQMTATGSFTGGTSPTANIATTTGGGSGVTDGSDVLAGFLLYPLPVATGDTVVHGSLLDTGRIIVARVPIIPLTPALRATNTHFRWV